MHKNCSVCSNSPEYLSYKEKYMFIQDIKNAVMTDSRRELNRIIYDRQEQRQKISKFIYWSLAIIAVIVVYIVLSTALSDKPQQFIVDSDYSYKAIHDESSLLTTEERQELLEAVEQTVGTYYKIGFINLDVKTEELYKAACNKTNLYEPATIMIVHNSDGKYYLLVSTYLVNNTKIFNLIDYSLSGTEDFFLQSNVAYQELFNGTPGQVYNSVLNHVIQHGPTGDDMENYIQDFCTTNNAGAWALSIPLALVIGIMIFALFAAMYDMGINSWIEYTLFHTSQASFFDSLVINYFEKKKKLQKQENEKIEKEAIIQQELAQRLEQDKQSNLQIAQVVIDKLNSLPYNNEYLVNKKKQLTEKLIISDKIISTERAPLDDVKFYFDNFIKGIDDILNYVNTHEHDNKNVDDMIEETLTLYLEIISSFNKKYEESDASNISITLNVLRQKAALDGFMSTDFK